MVKRSYTVMRTSPSFSGSHNLPRGNQVGPVYSGLHMCTSTAKRVTDTSAPPICPNLDDKVRSDSWWSPCSKGTTTSHLGTRQNPQQLRKPDIYRDAGS